MSNKFLYLLTEATVVFTFPSCPLPWHAFTFSFDCCHLVSLWHLLVFRLILSFTTGTCQLRGHRGYSWLYAEKCSHHTLWFFKPEYLFQCCKSNLKHHSLPSPLLESHLTTQPRPVKRPQIFYFITEALQWHICQRLHVRLRTISMTLVLWPSELSCKNV